ncbi:hypothetical protein R3P38DRAFT_2899999 [Favolaschia claudopus]|uniref:Uncharacterized protein n=1 Tax=Favolaschia claudopus TaxID=2862362 RepID=A0AAW0CLR3_9AGAR
MLRASWALVSFPLIPGTRSRLERSQPFFPFLVRLCRQDRYFSSSPRILSIKGPSASNVSSETATADAIEHKSDMVTSAPHNRRDNTGADVSTPTFRAPSFPLATVEELAPNHEVEAKPDIDSNIFESDTLEYREPLAVENSGSSSESPSLDACQLNTETEDPDGGDQIKLHNAADSEPLKAVNSSVTNEAELSNFEQSAYTHLPQSSLDILDKVARSLPAILPEPEPDSGEFFEEKSHDDYDGISTSTSPPMTSLKSLQLLVADKNYDEALRVLDALMEFHTKIPRSFAYQEAALWALRTPATTAAEVEEQIQTFRKWFSLVPRAHSSQSPEFRRLRERLIRSHVTSLRLVMEFGLIAVEKGCSRSTRNAVTSLVCMYGDSNTSLNYIEELLRRHRLYLGLAVPRSQREALENQLRVDLIGFAVKVLSNAGRFDHAVQLIPDPADTSFHLTPDVYLHLVDKMQSARDSRYDSHIKFITQYKSEARHRFVGLKMMEKPHLISAIRCLANTGHFYLAIGLLPQLQDTDASLTSGTFDFLLAKLNESQDEHRVRHLDVIFRVREGLQSGSSDTTSPTTTAGVNGPLPFDHTEYGRAIKALTSAWCLEEAVALIPAYHAHNTEQRKTLYDVLLWKLRISRNRKYKWYIRQLRKTRESLTVKSPRPASVAQAAPPAAQPVLANTTYLENFPSEQIYMASSLSSSALPLRVESALAASLRALRKTFRDRFSSSAPHPLSIVRFLEVYTALERVRAIPLLRNLALKRGDFHALSYIFAEMLFHARRRDPGLVLQTFATYFFIVGVPRDVLMLQLQKIKTHIDGPWAAPRRLVMKLFPHPMHAAVVWRALLYLTGDEALQALYDKLLQFADVNLIKTCMLHPNVPLLHPPPTWKTGVDNSAFTPFIRRLCRAFGPERGSSILQDMVRLRINPNIYQLTELAMVYSRAGDARRTLLILDQVESATHAAESVDADAPEQSEVAGHREAGGNSQAHLLPRVDQVFYVAIIRGLLFSKNYVQARNVERRMFGRYGYVPGQNRQVDELYEDLHAAEQGREIPRRETPISVAHNSRYNTLLEKGRTSEDLALAAFDSLGD